ncbi:heat shock protein 83 [Dorcoceras hygrometricum]|uniref:Heat shock protein 83 n=1 Tax=Dorcoceras hygrometricum TaxID=472368 RepID=A0A2Z7BF21_9LAMI|nr:heat shock protein 83 [Dorcoceras hygrometricum]
MLVLESALDSCRVLRSSRNIWGVEMYWFVTLDLALVDGSDLSARDLDCGNCSSEVKDVSKEYLAGTCAWLQPELQERRLFTTCGRIVPAQRARVQRVNIRFIPSGEAATAAGGGDVRKMKRGAAAKNA